ncbi:hypothetical protein CR513_18286, partial [Mucuna pruriens]
MAECVASAFCVKFNTQRRPVGERGFSGQITNLKTVQRKYSRSGCKFVHFSTWKTFQLSVFRATDLKFASHLLELPLKCIGLGALVDFDGATASDLVPVVDQVLLMGSIFLTYMAGVIPVEKSYAGYQKANSDKNVFPESSDISGSSAKRNNGVESKYVLDVVRGKLLNSLNALEHKAYSGDIILQSAKRPLSLSAVARGPKLRLLWATFQQVEEEAGIFYS